MRRRPGLTMTEAIVALFVAAVGIISLLVLFPLGAIQMGQALRDERALQTALKADGLLRFYWRDQVVERFGPDPVTGVQRQIGSPDLTRDYALNPLLPNFPLGADPFILAFDDPSGAPDAAPNPANPYSPQNPFNTLALPVNNNPTNVQPCTLIPIPPRTGFVRLRAAPGLPPLFDGPSYPVMIDMIGWQARTQAGTADVAWVAGRDLTGLPNPTTPCLPRRTLRRVYYDPPGSVPVPLPPTVPANAIYTLNDGQFTSNNPNGPFTSTVYGTSRGPSRPAAIGLSPLLASSLLDDLTYDEAGNAGVVDPNAPPPPPPPPSRVERLGRYNFAAVLQRPDNKVLHTATLSVMVFENRAPAYAPIGAERQYPRDSGLTLPVNMTVGSSSFDLYYAGEPPPIQKGRWVLDGTIIAPGTVAAVPNGIRNANFYRVASVTPGVDTSITPNQTYLRVELQTPITVPLGTTLAPNSTYQGQIYVFDGLTEVFGRPPLQAQLSSAP
jgi:hypothetical protein